MIRLVAMTVALGALLLAPTSHAATTTVSIDKNGFSPRTATIAKDDTVTWRNDDTRDHQVVATGGQFSSPVLKPGQSFSFTFTAATATTYDYRDGLNAKNKGSVRVSAPALSLTLKASTAKVSFGQKVTVSGIVSSAKAGEQVTVTAQPYGQPSPIVLATVVTGTGGTFAYVTKPSILTVYRAAWGKANSPSVTVGVAPAVTFGRGTVLWVTRVVAGRSFARKTMQIQRFSRYGQWVTIRRVVLDGAGRARFALVLPKGTSKLRSALSVNQAGAGYLGASSAIVTFTKK